MLELLMTLQGSLVLHPRLVVILASQPAGIVCFWDLVEETMVHQIQAHTSAVCSVAMHPEAKCMVSASNDGTAKVWRPPNLA